MAIVAVTGMKREARMAAGPSVIAVVRGDNPQSFRLKIERAIASGTRGVISFGIAGALNPKLRTGDVLVGTSVAVPGERIETDSAWRARLVARLPAPKLAVIAAAERIELTPAAKAALHRSTGADAVDLESGDAARLARAHALPFAVLRVISDEAGTALPEAAQVALDGDGGVNLGRVIRSLLARPHQLPALIKAASDSRRAFENLLRCLDSIGRGLAGPDLG